MDRPVRPAVLGERVPLGRVIYQKELKHEFHGAHIDTPPRPTGNPHVDWGQGVVDMSRDQWIGYKFVVQKMMGTGLLMMPVVIIRIARC